MLFALAARLILPILGWKRMEILSPRQLRTAMRHVIFASLLASLVLAAPVRAQDDAELIKAMQRTMSKVIQQHENSIACILVSRSEFHPRDSKYPGRLGVYEPDRLLIDPKVTGIEREQIRKKLDLADPTNIPPSFGSGVVIDAQGLILTNYHVVQDAAKIYVRLPGGKGSYADIHAADPRCDLAVLRLLNVNALPLRAIPLGDADKMERGNFVLTLSNPFAAGFRDGQPSASYGILSNIRRRAFLNLKEEERVKPFHYYSTLLQTDARLSLGCSGGALLNLKGELVGLITALAAIQGGETPGGFAVPINGAMRPIIDVLRRGEEVDYGFLGINVDPRNAGGQVGVHLKFVGEGSPAKLDGKLKTGDVLVAVDDQPIHESDDIFTTIGMRLAGSVIKLHYRRDGRDRFADIKLAKLYVPGKKISASLGSRPFVRGMRVDYSSLVVQFEERTTNIVPRGVLVTEVLPKTSASAANLKNGDIVTHVNNNPVTTPAAFYLALDLARGPIELTLLNTPPTKVVLK
jgi:serine protease Do